MNILKVIFENLKKMQKIADFAKFGPKYLGPQIFPRHAVCQGPIQGVTAGTQYRGPPTLGAPQVEFFYDKEKLAPNPNGYLHLLIISLSSTKLYTFKSSQGHFCGIHIQKVFLIDFKNTKSIYLQTFKLMFS